MTHIHLLVILLLALSCNIDNIGVGMSYGTRRIKIPFASNLLIAVITGTGTMLSMLAGGIISNYLSPITASRVGSLIIISAGIWILLQEIIRPVHKENYTQQEPVRAEINKENIMGKLSRIMENPVHADSDFSGHISLKEGLLLGLALMLNNLANGLGAGMAGLNPFATTGFVVLLSLMTIWCGLNFGHRYASRWLGDLAVPLSGIILIFVGIFEIFF